MSPIAVAFYSMIVDAHSETCRRRLRSVRSPFSACAMADSTCCAAPHDRSGCYESFAGRMQASGVNPHQKAMSAASGSDASRSAIRLTATPQVDGYQGCEQDQRRQCGKAQHANRCRCSPAVKLWTE